MTDIEVISRVKAAMSEKRFVHTEGCVKMAEKLAGRWNAPRELAIRAAWLHDIAKEIPYDEQLQMADKFGIILNRTQKNKKIIHAFTGALIAWQDFGECEEVCGAIRWHTTAHKNMTLLEKIIWLADLTEEGRSFPGVEEIRKLAFENIGEALILGFDTTLSFLISGGSEIDANMIEARNFEISQRVRKEQ